MSAPWWTSADRAEVAALKRVLVSEVYAHHERGCQYCEAGDPCPAVQAGIQAAVEFVELRATVSFAQTARNRQSLIDFAGTVAYAERTRR
jgi:hypothetical protein